MRAVTMPSKETSWLSAEIFIEKGVNFHVVMALRASPDLELRGVK